MEWPHDLLHEHGLAVVARDVVVRGRRHRVGLRGSIEAETVDPRPLAAIATAVIGAVGVPVGLSLAASTIVDAGWLLAADTALMLLPTAWVLTAQTRYRLALYASGRRVTLFTTDDPRLVVALTAALRSALERG